MPIAVPFTLTLAGPDAKGIAHAASGLLIERVEQGVPVNGHRWAVFR